MADITDLALLVLRAALGVVMLAHGARHLRGRNGTTTWVESIGFKNPNVQWFFMSFAEIGVGLSLLLGILTSIGAAGLVSLMVVAFWTVHRHAGFWITARPDEGWEYVFSLALAGLALAILGPGRFSVDAALGIGDTLDGALGAAVAAGGVAAAGLQLAVFFRPHAH